MSKWANFEELKANRKEFVEVAKKNGMLAGLTRLLTELYPDEAHFIYELLQNAEDKEATEVKFVLSYNKLVFSHNGKKRDFILDDIDAITNIGQSTKIDDATSIGKFGVGFKAVYTYTNTPEIHSGKYDFKILNMLIPENIGVDRKAQSGITQFVFPFDNPTKKPAKAVEEIRAGLLALDENSIIFLRHIKQIVFVLPDGKTGGVKVKDKDNNINKVIMHVNALTGQKTKTYWTKFSKDCVIKVDNQDKTYPVSIAYRMKKYEENESVSFKVDSELKGNVCIYFPAVKEHSSLHFHINAPFASTVARDSVRSCPENRLLIKEIAKLVVHSIYYFKNEKLLDLNFYATMPTRRDFDYGNDSEYYVIYTAVMEAFRTQEFIVTENGEYKKIPDVLQSNRDIVKLINAEDVFKLYKKYWVPAVNPQSRELYFLMELNIKQYDRRTIADTLKVSPKFFDGLFVDKSSEWFRDWYALLDDIVGITSYVDAFSRVAMVKCNDDMLHKPTDDIYLYNPDYQPTNISNPIYVDIPDTKIAANDKAKKFLQILGVELMTDKIDIMNIISNNDVVDTDDAINVLKKIIEKYNSGVDISDFEDQPLFLATERTTGKGYVVKAKNCSLSSEVAFFYQGNPDVEYILTVEDYAEFSPEEISTLYKVFESLGGKTKPEIVPSFLGYYHPQYKQLDTSNERSDTCVRSDYILSGCNYLPEIKKQGLYKESLLLWKLVVSDKNIRHHEAMYKANSRCKLKYLESSVAYYLRRIEWIPNKEGVFCRPCDITKDNLYEGFIYSDDCVFLKNLGFGDPKKAPSNIATVIKQAGIEISDIDIQWFQMLDEDKQAFLEFIEKRQALRQQQKLSFGDALEGANKDQVPYEEDDHYGEDIGIKKVGARQERQRKDFEEGLEVTPKKQQVWRYTYAAKGNGPEKQFVGEQYHGKCQICGRDAIRKANGKQYFEAINIIDTSSLDDQYLNNLDTGWNTLCLCPNCAAEYRYCQKNLSDLQEQIESTHIKERKSELIDLYIVLKNNKTKISFTPRHFLALQTAFQVFKEHENK